MPEERHQRIRQMYNIIAEGDDIPPPLCRFEVGIIVVLLYLLINAMLYLGHETTCRCFKCIKKKKNYATFAHTNARHSICV